MLSHPRRTQNLRSFAVTLAGSIDMHTTAQPAENLPAEHGEPKHVLQLGLRRAKSSLVYQLDMSLGGLAR